MRRQIKYSAQSTKKCNYVLVKANKMADSCASNFDAHFVALRKGCFTKIPHLNSIFCSAEAIRRSSWPIFYCMKESNRTQTHTVYNPLATVTPTLL